MLDTNGECFKKNKEEPRTEGDARNNEKVPATWRQRIGGSPYARRRASEQVGILNLSRKKKTSNKNT
jgi:hypothetical protein